MKAVKIVTDLDIVTFDIVKEPDMVFTRVTKISYTKEFVLEAIKGDQNFANFKYGESPLFCLHCFQCNGYDPRRREDLWGK